MEEDRFLFCLQILEHKNFKRPHLTWRKNTRYVAKNHMNCAWLEGMPYSEKRISLPDKKSEFLSWKWWKDAPQFWFKISRKTSTYKSGFLAKRNGCGKRQQTISATHLCRVCILWWHASAPSSLPRWTPDHSKMRSGKKETYFVHALNFFHSTNNAPIVSCWNKSDTRQVLFNHATHRMKIPPKDDQSDKAHQNKNWQQTTPCKKVTDQITWKENADHICRLTVGR